MKKSAAVLLALGMAVMGLAGCSGSSNSTATTAATEAAATTAETTTAVAETTTEAAKDSALEGPITVISREDGSGTRGAFIELFGIEVKNDAGEKVDMTTDDAEITNSTSVMMTSVAGNTEAIGYISLGSLNDTVKAVKIDGAEATVDNIKSGTYKIARPFNIATKGEVSDVAQDFIKYIMSEDGQKVVEDNGYISQGNDGAYESAGLSGKVVVGGSSSVTPVMEKLKEAYVALNPDVTIEVQQSDSTTGMTSAIEGVCDIGMASRDLKDSEIEKGLTGTTIAMDGIAVIVNNDSPVEELSSDSVKGIYTGEITDWADVQ
ncbi:MAG: substrate-binding domain-containing protein [Lachnospiraceae bacterium]|nr:substrate-binding domain-containing protein [Lachnospiraceae bacterium]